MVTSAAEGPDVLLLLPSAQRADSTQCALSLLRWTAHAVGRPPRAWALSGGELRQELRAAGVKLIESPRQPMRTVEHALLRIHRDDEARAVRTALHRYLFAHPPADVVLAIGTFAARCAEQAMPPATRLLTYCFDEVPGLDGPLDGDSASRLLHRTDGWVAAHRGIARDLERIGVAPRDLVTIPPFVDDPTSRSAPPAAATARRRALGLGPDDVLVGGFGPSDWRAGPEVFIRMASIVHRSHPDLGVRFVWVGAPHDGPLRWILEHDITKAGLDGVVTLTGVVDDSDAWVGALDVLALTGRLDALAPPTLQAAVAGVPLVGFDGGATHLLADETGGPPGVTLVEPLDVAGMAEAVAALASNPAQRAAGAVQVRAGSAPSRLAAQAAPRLWAAVEAVAARRPVAALAGEAPHDTTTREVGA